MGERLEGGLSGERNMYLVEVIAKGMEGGRVAKNEVWVDVWVVVVVCVG